jgi:NAD(P)-dependent dehydrogenase (short-subunit alcohol dehydrogenase family)
VIILLEIGERKCMRILLTGASGFIGQQVLQALLADGHQVVCGAAPAIGCRQDPRLSYVHADFANDTEQSVWLARLIRDRGRDQYGRHFPRIGQSNLRAPACGNAPRALFAACAASGTCTP